MAQVTLTHSLTQFTGGEQTFDVEASTIRGLLKELSARFPGLAPHLEEDIAVAIDGQIFQDALFEPIPPNSDVHIIPRIVGG